MNQNPGSKHCFLFWKKKKNITEESELEDFEDLIVALDEGLNRVVAFTVIG